MIVQQTTTVKDVSFISLWDSFAIGDPPDTHQSCPGRTLSKSPMLIIVFLRSSLGVMFAFLLIAVQLTTLDQHMRLGQDYLRRKDAGRAASEFETAVQLKPDSAPAHYNLG